MYLSTLSSLPAPAPRRHRVVVLAPLVVTALFAVLWLSRPQCSHAALAPQLPPAEKQALQKHWALVKSKFKGPYTINYCTCTNGEKAPVADDQLRVRADPCGLLFGADELFCTAYRTDLAQEMGDEYGLYVANIFANEVHEWDRPKDNEAVLKGFILEKYYMENHPEKPLTVFKSTGGISGAEFEVEYMPRYFEKVYQLRAWEDFTHYLVQYELQRRFFIRNDVGLIHQIRNLSSAIRNSYEPFKPLRDLIHNQMSAGQAEMVEAFQEKHPRAGQSQRFQRLASMLRQLATLDVQSLAQFKKDIPDREVRASLDAVLAAPEGLPQAEALGALAAACRDTVAARALPASQAIDVVDLAVAANALLTAQAMEMTSQTGRRATARETLQLMSALADGAYGAGLISRREHEEATRLLTQLASKESIPMAEMRAAMDRAGRVAEWAQASIRTAFADVWPAWMAVFPEVAPFPDDVIRASPLFPYARLAKSLTEALHAELGLTHDVLGRRMSRQVRPLNPGLAVGELAFHETGGAYSRETILALETTNAELEPVAGVITRDEGNAVSHVQLLARALGVPNAVFLSEAYALLQDVAGKELFYAITPGGRVVLKELSRMDTRDKTILAEYRKNMKRRDDGDARGGGPRLVIDADRLDLDETDPLPLTDIRRVDSGVICGPKAAYLGELKHVFPDNVARAVVLPFGAYAAHFATAKVRAPAETSLRVPVGTPLPAYVRGVYDEYFGTRLKDPSYSQAELAAWIAPRLEVIRHSIEAIELDAALVAGLRRELMNQGLIGPSGDSPTGIFVRSDTNVEDQPDFNGAGLNLTLFNLQTFDEVLDGVKKVWASPFTYRSFSWRQTVISDPNLVYPSLLLMESVPSEKSGVVVTADVTTGDPTAITVATAEGVGGAVDGSPAETLLVADGAATLLSQFKAQSRRLLAKDGGAYIAPSTGKERVLTDQELERLIAAAKTIERTFQPAFSSDGRRLPWDIEFGFVDGSLSLFQARPFVGNSDIQNLPALAALDKDIAKREEALFSLKESIAW